MAYELFHQRACWRCERDDVHLFETDGEFSGELLSTFLCQSCVEDLIEMRRIVESLRARGRRRRTTEKNSLIVNVVTIRVHGAVPVRLHYGDDALEDWAGTCALLPRCLFCGAAHGYHVYELCGDSYPIFSACRTCIRQVLTNNADGGNPCRLFSYVQRLRIDGGLQRLRWGSNALAAFLAADYPWAEVMNVDK